MKNGITLVALVVTIIVLLILAGVSISSINPGDGVIDSAGEARDQWNNAIQKDENRMNEVIEMNNRTKSE